ERGEVETVDLAARGLLEPAQVRERDESGEHAGRDLHPGRTPPRGLELERWIEEQVHLRRRVPGARGGEDDHPLLPPPAVPLGRVREREERYRRPRDVAHPPPPL